MTIFALIKAYEKADQPEKGLALIDSWLDQVQADSLNRGFELHFLYFKHLFKHGEIDAAFMINELIPYFEQKNEWIHLADYYPILAKLFENQQKYKQASQYYALAFEVLKNMHQVGVTYI